MIWTTFTVKGKHNQTKRNRTIKVKARNIEECRINAANQGLIEPLEIIENELKKPSENQINYANNVGIRITPDMSSYDVSALLNRYEDNDKSDPNPELLEYADAKGWDFSSYIGKKALYNLIFENLDGEEKISFFIFCIYRWLSEDRRGNLDTHPHKDIFINMADSLSRDDKFVKSMKRYNGKQLRFFGLLTIDGNTYEGGSTNTIAYKRVVDLLKNKFNLQNANHKSLNNSSNRSHQIRAFTANSEVASSSIVTDAINAVPFHRKSWFIILMLFIFSPIGITLMWVHKKFSKVLRIVLTILSAIYYLIVILQNGLS